MKKNNVYLIGAPNCGKTTLFNSLTGLRRTVGNRPGVTVDSECAPVSSKLTSEKIFLTDLPGAYSLDSYSPDEKVTGDVLRKSPPDLVIFVCDSTALERGLYPVTQLAEMNIPFILVLNMCDEAKIMGIKINIGKLSDMLKCDVVSVSALRGYGIKELVDVIGKSLLSEKRNNSTSSLKREKMTPKERHKLCSEIANKCISGEGNRILTEKVDSVVMNKFLAFPIFAAVIFGIYYISVTTIGGFLSGIFSDIICGEATVNFISDLLRSIGFGEVVISFTVNGILGGVGTIVGFIPQLVLLFFMLSVLEEVGYMTRVAVMTDRIFAFFGLSGRCSVPLIVGSGCSVSGILSSRIIDDSRERRIAIMTCSFIPCSAKLPVITLIASSVIGGGAWIAPCIYFIGICAVFFTSLLFSPRTDKQQGRFIMELPRYRRPRLRSVMKSVSFRVSAFIKKASSIILIIGIIIWLLSYVGIINGRLVCGTPTQESFISKIGQYIAPVFAPLGFGFWEAAVATIMGLAAKEELASVLGVLSSVSMCCSSVISSGISVGFTAVGAFSFLIFNMLCIPCAASVSAMKHELNNKKYFIQTLIYQSVFAYLFSFTFYQIANSVISRKVSVLTVFAFLLLILALIVILLKGFNSKKQSANRKLLF